MKICKRAGFWEKACGDGPEGLAMTRIYKCTHLTVRGKRTACGALRAFYAPNSFEIQEYCKTNEHRKCPFYFKGIACMTPGKGGMSLRI